MHIDAAYAGSSFICPEYRHLLNGVEVGLNGTCNACMQKEWNSLSRALKAAQAAAQRCADKRKVIS